MNQPALELGQRGENVKDEFPGHVGGIDGAITDGSKSDAFVAQPVDQRVPLRHGATAPIQPHHQQDVA